MKKQIQQIFKNLISKEKKPDVKMDEENLNPMYYQVADGAKSGAGKNQDIPVAVQVVDRKTFESIVNEDLSEVQEKGCLLIADVDKFRNINDIYGHDIGDAVLRYVVNVFYDIFGDLACIGSFGGDIFALWLSEVSCDNAGEIRTMTGMVNDRLLHPERELPPVSLSVGISFGKSGDDSRSLGKKANKALYLVKGSGRCGCEMSL